ncbi:hypothetical protein YB2330_005598 [Saitoella coloradoensis]
MPSQQHEREHIALDYFSLAPLENVVMGLSHVNYNIPGAYPATLPNAETYHHQRPSIVIPANCQTDEFGKRLISPQLEAPKSLLTAMLASPTTTAEEGSTIPSSPEMSLAGNESTSSEEECDQKLKKGTVKFGISPRTRVVPPTPKSTPVDKVPSPTKKPSIKFAFVPSASESEAQAPALVRKVALARSPTPHRPSAILMREKSSSSEEKEKKENQALVKRTIKFACAPAPAKDKSPVVSESEQAPPKQRSIKFACPANPKTAPVVTVTAEQPVQAQAQEKRKSIKFACVPHKTTTPTYTASESEQPAMRTTTSVTVKFAACAAVTSESEGGDVSSRSHGRMHWDSTTASAITTAATSPDHHHHFFDSSRRTSASHDAASRRPSGVGERYLPERSTDAHMKTVDGVLQKAKEDQLARMAREIEEEEEEDEELDEEEEGYVEDDEYDEGDDEDVEVFGAEDEDDEEGEEEEDDNEDGEDEDAEDTDEGLISRGEQTPRATGFSMRLHLPPRSPSCFLIPLTGPPLTPSAQLADRLPDAVDFVAGRMEEDQAAEEAFANAVEEKRARQRIITPQDIDPYFPDDVVEDEEEVPKEVLGKSPPPAPRRRLSPPAVNLNRTKSLPGRNRTSCRAVAICPPKPLSSSINIAQLQQPRRRRGALDIVKGLERRKAKRKGLLNAPKRECLAVGAGAAKMAEMAKGLCGKKVEGLWVLSV